MPFQSEAQRRACWAQQGRAQAQGKKSSWDCEKWEHETSNKRNLPFRKSSKKTSRKSRKSSRRPRKQARSKRKSKKSTRRKSRK